MDAEQGPLRVVARGMDADQGPWRVVPRGMDAEQGRDVSWEMFSA